MSPDAEPVGATLLPGDYTAFVFNFRNFQANAKKVGLGPTQFVLVPDPTEVDVVHVWGFHRKEALLVGQLHPENKTRLIRELVLEMQKTPTEALVDGLVERTDAGLAMRVELPSWATTKRLLESTRAL